TGKYVTLVIIEFFVGLFVAISNILIILILAIGARKLMKNHFYVVLSNLILFTSMKGFVELAFILPYYVQQNGLQQGNIPLYKHQCNNAEGIWLTLLYCFIYVSYACTAVVLALYGQRKRSARSNSTQMQLLRQSFLVFALYAMLIGIVFAIPYIPREKFGFFELSYVENLLNLSIAAVYPICFLAMSGEMRKVTPRSSDRVSSIGSN
ncbi:hypothetical protein PENTCL1PPCAC_15873, partial [Pristionchus entomophagus]